MKDHVKQAKINYGNWLKVNYPHIYKDIINAANGLGADNYSPGMTTAKTWYEKIWDASGDKILEIATAYTDYSNAKNAAEQTKAARDTALAQQQAAAAEAAARESQLAAQREYFSQQRELEKLRIDNQKTTLKNAGIGIALGIVALVGLNMAGII